MAPQPAAPRKPAVTSRVITGQEQQDMLDNEDAVVGTAEDSGSRRGVSERANQSQGQTEDDPLGGGTERREPIQRAPQDDVRAQIAARFRRSEPEDEVPFNGDMSDPAMTLGDIGRDLNDPLDDDFDDDRDRTLDPVVGSHDRRISRAQPQNEGDNEPRMITRKVRGKDVTMSEEEWLDRASQVTAADSYLEEARAMLDQAKEIRAGRAAQSRQHPDGEEDTSTQDDPPNLDDDQHPDLSFKDIVEKIQFGDVDEAASLLEKAIEQRAVKSAKKGQLEVTFDQDLKRSQKALREFTKANPDLAADEDASMLVERHMYALYRDDMKKLGLSEDQIPKMPNEVANWHRFYRVNGYEVRPTSALLEAAGKHVRKRLGIGQDEPLREQPRREKPRVQVNVDRDARRQNIPLQPQRGATPRRDLNPAPVSKGSDVVMAMRRARGQV
jgi:hypothetical protein